MFIENGSTPRIEFLLVADTDGYSGSTGKSPTVTLSKNGGAFAAADGTPVEIGNGWYYIDLIAGETDTDGPLIINVTEDDSLDWRYSYRVASQALDDDDYDRIADHVLRRWFSNARDSDHGDAVTGEGLQYNAMGMLLSSGGIVYIDGNLLKTLQEDEDTLAYQREVETNASAVPITGLRTPS